MSKRTSYTLATLATLPLLNSAAAQVAEKPNLLYIFPDQQRLHALSIWSDPDYQAYLKTKGDPVHTPNIDKLAREGVLFSQATSTHPVSSPHRAMLMSGMYPRANGVETNCVQGRETELKHDIICLTDVLAQAGYQTAYVGKTHWHKTEKLFNKEKNYVGTTEAPGGYSVGAFDTYIPEGKSRHSNIFWYQHLRDNHHNAYAFSNRPELIGQKEDGQIFQTNTFSAKREADVIIQYIENKNGERETGKPFSIMWAPNPPHTPYNSVEDCDKEVFETYYQDKTPEELFVRLNVEFKDTQSFSKRVMNAKVYFSLIKSIDDEVGRVLDALEAAGEKDKTIIVFTSDHGEMMNSHEKMAKNIFYDESFLVPYIIRYPKGIQPHVEDLLIGSVDIMPTMLGLMGLEEYIPSSVKGVNYAPGLKDGTFPEGLKPKSAFYIGGASRGVRTNRYTYVVKESGECLIFNNVEDPYQMKPLSADDIAAKDLSFLKGELGQWLKKADDLWYEEKMHTDLICY